MKKNVFFLALVAIVASSAVHAQNSGNSVAATNQATSFDDFEIVAEETVTYSNRSDFKWDEFEIELDDTQINWTFHTDLAYRLLYIDFKALGGKMSSVQLTDASGKILFEDKLLQTLPTNTIYEVSLQTLPIGNYFVLLHSLTGVIRQEIRITE